MRRARGIVHEQERPLAIQHRMVIPGNLRFIVGELVRGAIGTYDVRHGVGRGQGLLAGALEVEINLRVGIALSKHVRQLQRQRRFPNPTHATQARDCDAALLDRFHQLFEFGLAASEVSRWRRQLMQCGSR